MTRRAPPLQIHPRGGGAFEALAGGGEWISVDAIPLFTPLQTNRQVGSGVWNLRAPSWGVAGHRAQIKDPTVGDILTFASQSRTVMRDRHHIFLEAVQINRNKQIISVDFGS